MTNTMAFTLRKNTVTKPPRMIVSSRYGPAYTGNENSEVGDVCLPSERPYYQCERPYLRGKVLQVQYAGSYFGFHGTVLDFFSVSPFMYASM